MSDQPPLVPGIAGGRHGPERLPPEVWQALLADEELAERYHSRAYQRDGCWYWLGAISSSGHGKLRVPGGRVVTAHVYGYQLANGLLVAPAAHEPPIVRHHCDEASCQRPTCWAVGTRADNVADYLRRRNRGRGHPLADVRGPARRAIAIRDAILQAQARGRDVETAIWSAQCAGLGPTDPDPLF